MNLEVLKNNSVRKLNRLVQKELNLYEKLYNQICICQKSLLHLQQVIEWTCWQRCRKKWQLLDGSISKERYRQVTLFSFNDQRQAIQHGAPLFLFRQSSSFAHRTLSLFQSKCLWRAMLVVWRQSEASDIHIGGYIYPNVATWC